MARPRVPLIKAEVTGRTTRNPKRFKDRKEPSSQGPLGEAPKWFKTQRQLDAWNTFRDELPWLDRSHRSLIEIAATKPSRHGRLSYPVRPAQARRAGRWLASVRPRGGDCHAAARTGTTFRFRHGHPGPLTFSHRGIMRISPPKHVRSTVASSIKRTTDAEGSHRLNTLFPARSNTNQV
jgi:hypothetical protein